MIAGTFTAGVFQDAQWAERGITALIDAGFAPESLSILAKDSAEARRLVQDLLSVPAQHFDIKSLGAVLASGPLVAVLQGDGDGLVADGIAATVRRAGFQSHDGHIFETLVGRGGVLVAIDNVARAADALAKLHAYGAGNAAIGAWAGRV